MEIACKWCTSVMKTEEEYFVHMESEHNIPMAREGETPEDALRRMRLQYPEANSAKTCKCPTCVMLRGDR